MPLLPQKEALDTLRKIAEARGGKLLSDEYFGQTVKLEFQDAGGNIFYTAPEQIRIGTWSPYEGQVSEPVCRQAMNYLFNTTFEKTKQVLTAKVLNRKMPFELDGYCSKLKIAFEYQGYPNHWDPTHYAYDKTIIRDKLKKEICEKLGLKLIIIPALEETSNRWHSKNVLNHVIKSVNDFYTERGLKPPRLKKKGFQVDLTKNNHCLKMMNRMRDIAKTNNGEVISTMWLGMDNKYVFKTDTGQEFIMTGGNILNRNRGWPKKGADVLKTDSDKLQELKDIAEANGGKLLSKKWVNANYEYKFKHSNGKEFIAKATSINYKGWPKGHSSLFNGPKEYFNELKQMAKAKGITILEEKYLGDRIKHKLLSPCNRIFYQTPLKIKSEGFIKDFDLYFKTDKEKLQEIKDIALNNGGKVLEKKWLGNNVLHKCQFSDGRTFSMMPLKIKAKWPKDINNYFGQMKVAGWTNEQKLERIKNIALKNGGKLLEKKWLGAGVRHKFLFGDGRPFSIKPQLILASGWPKGETTLFYTDGDYYNEMKKIAEDNGGKLLDKKWLGNRTAYNFKFADGRKFKMVPASLKNRGWPKDPDRYFNQVNGKAKKKKN